MCRKTSSKTDILNTNVITELSHRAFYYCVDNVGQQKQRDADEMQMTLAFQVLPICWENRSKCAKGQMNDVDKKSLRGLEMGEFLKTREVGEPSAGRRLLGDGVELCLQGQVG